MEWGKLAYLLAIIVVGYLPYKTLQRIRPHGLGDISKTTAFLLFIWFLILSIILFLQTDEKIIVTSPTTVPIAVVTTLLWFFSPYLIRKIGTYPTAVIAENQKWFVIRFEPKTLYLKYVEVLFQQVKFLYLIFVVFGALTMGDRVLWFTLLVGLLHLGNVFFLSTHTAMIFFILSLPMGVLFGMLMLNGYILVTIAIHLWFYLLFGGWYWLRR